MIESLENELEMLERHTLVLRLVVENEPIGIVSISNETDIPHHKIRYSLRILEEEGLIEATSQGAVTTDDIDEFLDSHGREIDDVIEQVEALRFE